MLQLLLLAMLMAARYRSDRQLGRQRGIAGLRWDQEQLAIRFAGTGWQPVEIGRHSRLFSFALLLELHTADGRRLWLPLFADAAEAEGFRRLLVELRYRMSSSPPQS